MKTWYVKRPSWGERDFRQDRTMPYLVYRQRQLHGYYVVSATHPDKPNWSGHARGRKEHLAETNQLKSKTLCNMLVDGVFDEHIDLRKDDTWTQESRLNGNCQVCWSKKLKFNLTPKETKGLGK